jgi:hypothetical protein
MQHRMTSFQSEKAIVRRLHDELGVAKEESVAGIIGRHVSSDWKWRGVHPFNEQAGPDAVAEAFWSPLLTSLTKLQRRPDIFFAGLNEIDGFESCWVVEMGHLMGLFDRPLLGIRPTGRIAMLRYAEFHRVTDGRISETAMFVDLPHFMTQVGQNPFPPQTGAHLVQPGPLTHDGLLYDEQPAELGRATLAAINAMLNNPGLKFHAPDEAVRLARVWHDDMIWWGPGGIGASFTIERYIRQHCLPFDDALSQGYRFDGHICQLAEGHYGGFFGWPEITLSNAGGYMGMTASPGLAEMRVVDLYRRQGDKLAENWIFIDMLHYMATQGLDVLGRMATLREN